MNIEDIHTFLEDDFENFAILFFVGFDFLNKN
jgi:hypothetical protein